MSKNKEFERRRIAAKKYAKTDWMQSRLNEHGNYVYHCYDNPDVKKTEGWWDDVSFKFGSQKIVVAWVHPRMAFSDETDNQAHLSFKSAPKWDIFDKAKPIYKKVGSKRARKKVIAWATSSDKNESHDNFRKWMDEFGLFLEKFRSETDLVIRPSIKIEQMDYCRYVTLVCPIEVVDEASLNQMAELTKKILRRETTLEKEFPNYTYTKEDWLKEGHDGTI